MPSEPGRLNSSQRLARGSPPELGKFSGLQGPRLHPCHLMGPAPPEAQRFGAGQLGFQAACWIPATGAWEALQIAGASLAFMPSSAAAGTLDPAVVAGLHCIEFVEHGVHLLPLHNEWQRLRNRLMQFPQGPRSILVLHGGGPALVRVPRTQARRPCFARCAACPGPLCRLMVRGPQPLLCPLCCLSRPAVPIDGPWPAAASLPTVLLVPARCAD